MLSGPPTSLVPVGLGYIKTIGSFPATLGITGKVFTTHVHVLRSIGALSPMLGSDVIANNHTTVTSHNQKGRIEKVKCVE